LGFGGPELVIARDWIGEGTARATEDFDRFYAEDLQTLDLLGDNVVGARY